MLAYENEMFLTAMQEDGLTIAAKGLGLEQVFLSLVRVHCDPGNLVLVLGCSDAEEAWIIRKMEEHVCQHLNQFQFPALIFLIRARLSCRGG